MKFLKDFGSITALVAQFRTEKSCREFLAEFRWHGNIICPYCGCKKVYHKKDGRYICKDCKRTFSVLVGTVFQNTKVSLLLWFIAIHLICNSKKGISSCHLARELGVTQKTAWYMLQKIRILLKDESEEKPEEIPISVKHEQENQCDHQQARMVVHPYHLHLRIRQYVRAESRIYSDKQICSQTLLESELEKYHTEDPYVPDTGRESIADGFWLQVKRMVSGVYHYVSASLFHRYVDEAIFRHETRRKGNGKRLQMFLERIGKVVTYKEVRTA